MATTVYLRNSTTAPSAGPTTIYRDMNTVAGFLTTTLTTDTAAGPDERPFRVGGTGPAIDFYSERVSGQVTIAGAISITMGGLSSDAAFTGRFRVRLYTITAGGSDVKTLIGTADASTDLTTTATTYTFGFTPSPSVTVADNERLIASVTVIPTGSGGTSFGTGFATLRYAGNTTYRSLVTVAETVSFLVNGVVLRLRRTNTIGIGSFRDMTPGAVGASPAIEANTHTVGGATELPWTTLTQVGTIVVTEVAAAAIANTSNIAAYVSASFTPVANRLYLLAVVHSDTAPETTEPTISTTTGLSFVQLADNVTSAISQPFDTLASNVHKLTLFRAMKPSGLSAGTYTVNFADAATGCAAMLVEVTGVVTSGADGFGAIRDTNITMHGFDATVNPTLGGLMNSSFFLESYNGVFACFGSSIQTAPTAAAGYTGLSSPDYATPSTGLFGIWRATADISPSVTLASSNCAAIAVELVAAQTSAVIEWISPRMKIPWYFGSTDYTTGHISASSYDARANAGMRCKLFHRAPDGTETLVFTVEHASEMTASATLLPWLTVGSGTLNQAMAFHEDDRLVCRLYAFNLGGTMGDGYTLNLLYDPDAGGTQDQSITLYEAWTFKAESDPAATTRIEGGLTMGGVGN